MVHHRHQGRFRISRPSECTDWPMHCTMQVSYHTGGGGRMGLLSSLGRSCQNIIICDQLWQEGVNPLFLAGQPQERVQMVLGVSICRMLSSASKSGCCCLHNRGRGQDFNPKEPDLPKHLAVRLGPPNLLFRLPTTLNFTAMSLILLRRPLKPLLTDRVLRPRAMRGVQFCLENEP